MKSIFLVCMLSVGLTAKGQTKLENLFSRIYFPFDFGVSTLFSEALDNGTLSKTGVEYRLKHKNGLYFRLNFDNRKSDYLLNALSPITNIENGTVQFSDIVIGPGYRIGNQKWQFTGLVQTGNTNYSIDNVAQNSSGFRKISIQRNLLLSKTSTGLEYYLYENAALTFEVSYLYHWQQKDFFIENPNGLTFSIGLTTTLF